MKIQIEFENNISVFEIESTSVDDFERLQKFIESNYKFSAFTMQYFDEENDCVTIASNADLKDAIDLAEAMEQKLKIVVKKQANLANPIVSNLGSEEKFDEYANKKNNFENKDEELKNSLIEDIINNEKFRKEFVLFACSFLNFLREDEAHDIVQAFIQALSTSESIQKHPEIVKFSNILPIIAPRVQPFAFFLAALDPNTVPQLIDQFVNAENNNECGLLPPWIHALRGYFGAFDPLHGFHPPHGSPHGFHVPPHGFHVPPHHQHPHGVHPHPPPHGVHPHPHFHGVHPHPPPHGVHPHHPHPHGVHPHPPPHGVHPHPHPHGVHPHPPPHGCPPPHDFNHHPFFGFLNGFIPPFNPKNAEPDVNVLSEKENVTTLPNQCESQQFATKEKDEEMKKLLSERENLKSQLEKVEAQLQHEKMLTASENDQIENEVFADCANRPMGFYVNGTEDQLYEKEIESLLAMGFGDEKLLQSLLKQYDGNVDRIVEVLS